ncbi:MAG: tRNA 2-thiouridine(34) synthase MnmA [Planctomycetota bacterium]|jgi:tRNA-specific 2-thiouridylase|nr:tRNA 2-thiouridine(34) synthase MnmA [Planctomycetota bacterium]MDP6940615.1 tRNA 2-thiouridine(34) synthase MnmA [Planctomycetota bacterium]
MPKPRVLIALSGGVDSSVAAILLKKQGYELVGAFLRNGVPTPSGSCRPSQGCCSESDARDAALVADTLGIPFHSLDMEEEFKKIQTYFRDSYQKGQTPNPCAVCNRDVKFGALESFADAIGASYIATGHYARISNVKGELRLMRGVDPVKDQSYVLFPVPESILQRTLLPVGELEKSETRQIARDSGLKVSEKPDSQEICFVPSGDYRDCLAENGGMGLSGSFLNTSGEKMGTHQGHMSFTRGQRRGLGISWTEPLFVLDIDPLSGDVRVGTREETGCRQAELASLNAFGFSLEPGQILTGITAQYRSTPGGVPAQLEVLEGARALLRFDKPAESVNPGQGVALYQDNRMIAGAWLERAEFSFVTP